MAKQTLKTIGDLSPDPRNCRKHNPRNMGVIVDSMHKVGAGRSIVIDETDTVLAGNATVEAAAEAGIENVLVVETNGNTLVAVKRTGLTAEQKALLAISDNRASELADWDGPQLVDVIESLELKPADIGFTKEEIDKLLDSVVDPEGGERQCTCPACGHQFPLG